MKHYLIPKYLNVPPGEIKPHQALEDINKLDSYSVGDEVNTLDRTIKVAKIVSGIVYWQIVK